MDYCFCEYGEPVDLWNVCDTKARKPWVCDECDEAIDVGETYKRVSMLFEGDWSHYRFCVYYYHDWTVLQKMGYCVDIGEGHLVDAWKQAMGSKKTNSEAK